MVSEFTTRNKHQQICSAPRQIISLVNFFAYYVKGEKNLQIIPINVQLELFEQQQCKYKFWRLEWDKFGFGRASIITLVYASPDTFLEGRVRQIGMLTLV